MKMLNAVVIGVPAIFVGIFCFVGFLLKPIAPIVVFGLFGSVVLVAVGVLVLVRAVKRHRTHT